MANNDGARQPLYVPHIAHRDGKGAIVYFIGVRTPGNGIVPLTEPTAVHGVAVHDLQRVRQAMFELWQAATTITFH